MKYLYHYTSLEVLALILKNRSICFNSLLNVDDIEEPESKDMGNFGKYVYVSCWTDDKEESIPLWNLYTPDMHGVRIRLPEFPFERYHYTKGEFFCENDIDTYIDCEKNYNEKNYSIAPTCPELIKVEYTNNEEELFPIVKKESYPGAAQDFLNAKSIEELKVGNIKVSYSFKELGNYKRENWRFQQEWRYKITIAPMGIKELNPLSFEKQQEYVKRLENKNTKIPKQRLFLNIDESILKEMEVVFGPKMSEAEKILAIALLDKYNPDCKYRDSHLKIK